jgi:hypothetical protein
VDTLAKDENEGDAREPATQDVESPGVDEIEEIS